MSNYWTQTVSGKAFDFEDPQPDMVCIEDIAYSLSNLARYNGHSRPVYTVGDHSLHVCARLPSDLKLEGLLHDAVEAYTGDLIAPLKHKPELKPVWKAIDEAIQEVVSIKFGIPVLMHPLVRDADLRMLETEKRDLGFLPTPRDWVDTGLEPYPEVLIPVLDNRVVEKRFLEMFDLYRGSEP